MPVRAVVLPATVLLVPGAAGLARPLATVRAAVRSEVARCTGPDGEAPTRWGVLAPAVRSATGRRRPSLAAAGIADRWVAGLRDGHWPAGARGDVPASVVQLVLADVAGSSAAADALVVELAPAADEALLAAAEDALAGCDAVLVAAGDPAADVAAGPDACAPAVEAVLGRLAGRSGWTAATRTLPVTGPHLPGRYDVVTWSGTGAVPPGVQTAEAANQPTPVSSSQKRTVRPRSTAGT